MGASEDYPRWTEAGVVTGDVGARAGDLLFCLGRAGRRVKRHGRFLDLDALDALVGRALGAASYSVLVEGGELVTLVETQTAQAADLRSTLAGEVGPGQLPDRLLGVPTLPRLATASTGPSAAREASAPS